MENKNKIKIDSFIFGFAISSIIWCLVFSYIIGNII